ncbi:hypothetical protein JXM67_08650 [candidate division WOR-3 bacterium]|nr:hypothetical protein [candidate division WOR-3 bacterium]
MKRVGVLIVLPLLVFALERVNLIKDHSFEKDSEVWNTYLTGTGFPNFVAQVNRHDSERAFTGKFSGSEDNRPLPDEVWDTYRKYFYYARVPSPKENRRCRQFSPKLLRHPS